ncbi:hypothetical protein JG687_00008377 [Phytophthora cactorum]|uniref:Uncharacterized protein n=1 Tax=Phytophthora cactorum TaxID=29920 RepID=A0A329S129_9STRA|nr:hypothetical protein GQ600_16866 [Phytophthora cactorum]KAF1788841.1 hypothetical protein GQ600_20126 [Phytophthora cactorum]KAG2787543.1 hypothetical protein Pcac1_g3227 [Phytophthora cactorum]KAG2815438.1 hypothetical protein PC111_g13576 [Phytophthora cactorum]KAG2815454.1 hypothetical protein PC112_g13870 [Phytophthora cactorum]
MAKLFERNPRNVRIASWVVAVGLFAAWYKYDQLKERQFSETDATEWNEAILRMHPQKPSKKKKNED